MLINTKTLQKYPEGLFGKNLTRFVKSEKSYLMSRFINVQTVASTKMLQDQIDNQRLQAMRYFLNTK